MDSRRIATAFIVALVAVGFYWKWTVSSMSDVSDPLEKIRPGSGISLATISPRGNELSDGEKERLPVVVSGEVTHFPAPRAAPIEATLVNESGLRTDNAQRMLESDGFDALLERINSDYANDIEVARIKDIYAARVSGSLESSGISVAKMACGVSICAASLTGQGLDRDAFVAALMTGPSGSAVIPSSVVHLLPGRFPDSPSEYRVVFATDPQYSSLRVGRGAPGKR